MVELTDMQSLIFQDRYALKDEQGNSIEKSPEEMWRRVAHEVSKNESENYSYNKWVTLDNGKEYWENRFYDLMEDFKFVPGGRILQAGTAPNVTYMNCFVCPSPQDSRRGILESLADTVDTLAMGGGVGINLSSLRPKGAYIKTVNGHSSGPVSWMELYSVATGDVVQQGGSRRGALLICLNDWHPDIEEFITRKSQFVTDAQGISRPEYLRYSNISVAVSDAFMDAVKKDLDWNLVFPDTTCEAYAQWDGDLDNWKNAGYPIKVYKTVKAREIWDLIAQSAWKSADPGLLFLERANKQSNSSNFATIISTNPCGEQPLEAYSVCLLGSLNLLAFVKDKQIDFESLGNCVKTAVRFLDDVIDINTYPLWQNEVAEKEQIRRMGLGTMGLADALIACEIRYGSHDSIDFINRVYSFIKVNAYKASIELAKERGSFGKYANAGLENRFFINTLPLDVQEDILSYGLRNCFLLTNAPTGTTSLLAGVSSGIEPVFDFSFRRVDRTGEHIIYHPLYEKWRYENKYAPDNIPSYFVTSNEVTWQEHVEVQAAIQQHMDSSISKTCNMPNTATVEDVKAAYMMAYDMNCKGFTVYRDGSRDAVLYHLDEDKEISDVDFKPVSNPINGKTFTIDTPVGKAHIVVNRDEANHVAEVFINVGKAGSDIQADSEALGRLLSLIFRMPTTLSYESIFNEVVHQLNGIGGASSVGFGVNRVRSLADGIAKILAAELSFEILDKVEDNITAKRLVSNMDFCPECGNATLIYEEGCKKCLSCFWSAC